jgi:hypothetical protein
LQNEHLDRPSHHHSCTLLQILQPTCVWLIAQSSRPINRKERIEIQLFLLWTLSCFASVPQLPSRFFAGAGNDNGLSPVSPISSVNYFIVSVFFFF